MKPFNLEEAKAGKPVCTRDGRPARLIYQDLQGEYPFVFAITSKDGVNEKVREYNYSGQYYDSEESKHDLFMAPVQHTVWVNLYSAGKLSPFPSDIAYASEEIAKRAVCETWPYLGTFPITYEE